MIVLHFRNQGFDEQLQNEALSSLSSRHNSLKDGNPVDHVFDNDVKQAVKFINKKKEKNSEISKSLPRIVMKRNCCCIAEVMTPMPMPTINAMNR